MVTSCYMYRDLHLSCHPSRDHSNHPMVRGTSVTGRSYLSQDFPWVSLEKQGWIPLLKLLKNLVWRDLRSWGMLRWKIHLRFFLGGPLKSSGFIGLAACYRCFPPSTLPRVQCPLGHHKMSVSIIWGTREGSCSPDQSWPSAVGNCVGFNPYPPEV